jgi:hypothetical protein
MPSKHDVLEALRATGSYEQAARSLGIPAGQAHLIATGVPADGSSPLEPSHEGREGLLTSPQHLVNPTQHNPLRKEHVLAWVREQAKRGLTPGS